MTVVKQRADLTYKYNHQRGRHGWLRLTPAYSVKMVRQILAQRPQTRRVLDPFSGTGTTGLVCAENGIDCDLVDINPFLVWFAQAKTANYAPAHLQTVRQATPEICELVRHTSEQALWLPPIHNINRWWSQNRLVTLAKIFDALNKQFQTSSPAKDIFLVAFCNLIIHWSNASFNHQSMSFQDPSPQDEQPAQLSFLDQEQEILDHLVHLVNQVVGAAQTHLDGRVNVILADSRCLDQALSDPYDCVITSPPYPNRMSYIRELRPYMYWLGYLETGRQAGELDWQAIGGTWGIATSRLDEWQPDGNGLPHSLLDDVLESISEHSETLSNYVHRYFIDIYLHLKSLYPLVTDNAQVYYIVGNSRFYDTLVPVEEIYANLLTACGFENPHIEKIRKRNSKKELFEFIVSATKREDHK